MSFHPFFSFPFSRTRNDDSPLLFHGTPFPFIVLDLAQYSNRYVVLLLGNNFASFIFSTPLRPKRRRNEREDGRRGVAEIHLAKSFLPLLPLSSFLSFLLLLLDRAETAWRRLGDQRPLPFVKPDEEEEEGPQLKKSESPSSFSFLGRWCFIF